MVRSIRPQRLRPGGKGVSSVLKRRVKSPAERRQDILDAALKLFASKGFHETSIDEIAAEAGVAKGTIYIYFPTKDHILMGLKEQFQRGLEERLNEALADFVERVSLGDPVDYREVTDHIFDVIVDYNLEHRDICEVAVRETPGPQMAREALELERNARQRIAATLRVAIEAGLVHFSDPEMLAYLLISAVRDNLVTSIVYGDPPDLRRLVAAAKELCHKALSPKAGAVARPADQAAGAGLRPPEAPGASHPAAQGAHAAPPAGEGKGGQAAGASPLAD